VALQYLSDDMIYHATNASLLEGTSEIRFTHQLLQEFFSAYKLDKEMKTGTPANEFWPDSVWWESQGLEQTAVLLAGLYNDDVSPVVRWLQDANPRLAALCVTGNGASISQDTRAQLRSAWLPRLIDVQISPNPHARYALGWALGKLDIDSRKRIGL